MENRWKIGFNKEIITPDDYKTKKYYLAGYNRNMVVKGVLDDVYARTIWMDDSSGKGGVSITVLDCIGMSYKDVNEIRDSLKDFCASSNTRAVNIMFTHDHGSVDTQGLWGRGMFTGRNKKYIAKLKQIVKQSVISAYNNVKSGNLFFGKTLTKDMILDNRLPFVYDDNLYRMHFVADDKSELFILNFGCHPEQIGKENHLITADWPCYMGREIKEKSGAEFIFINGAIGAITSLGLNEVFAGLLDGEKSMKEYGIKMGGYALSIKDEYEIKPKILFKTEKFNMPAENSTFSIAKKVGLINNEIMKVKGKTYKYEFPTEVSYMEIGSIKVLLIPGELFPEIALGGFFDASKSAKATEYPRSTLFELIGEGEKLIFGLANDEIGYIIPDNDFYISPKRPYAFWAIPKDQHGRPHYEETTCSGPYAAEYVWNAVKKLMETK